MPEISSEKRILIAFGLSFLVLAGWASYMRHKYPPPERPPQEAPAGALAPPAVAKPTERKPEAAPAAGRRVPGVVQGTEERWITVETDVATIVFSTRGARVESWTLKNFRDESGEPLELVQGGKTGLGYPLSLEWASPLEQAKLNQALFVVNIPGTSVQAPAELTFEWSNGQLAARKRLRFDNSYLCELETSVLAVGQPLAHGVAWPGGFGDLSAPAAGFQTQLFIRAPDKLRRHPAAKATETTGWLYKTPSPFPYVGEAAYAGIADRYFAAVFFPENGALSVTASTGQWTPPKEKKPQPVGGLAVGAAAAAGNHFRLFVGPKDIDVLEQVSARGTAPSLADELVDFGWFWWIAQPLFLAMKWMHAHWIPNYGWVIVLLTMIINSGLFPLKWRSMQSAWEMQKIGPQVRAIQERYKKYRFNDPRKQQMQGEIMALYKEHGVNPLGGCFPLLLQLPFFYGFYRVLATAIELRQAPWFGWIHDLSQKDPTYVLPIVMGVTMFVSTKMTPMTTTDPAQQKMMQFFPLIFAFMFFQVSSGLVLYWLMSSAVGIGQQWWMNKHQRKRELAEKLAAKERKKKKPPAEEPGEQD